MEESIFLQILHKIPVYNQGKEALKQGQSPIVLHEMGETSRAHVIYGMVEDIARNALVITYNEAQARKIYEDLKLFLGQRVLYFSTEPIAYYFVEAYSKEVTIERLQVFKKLLKEDKIVIVASVEAIMKKLEPKERFQNYWHTFQVGQTIEIQQLQKILMDCGYERVDEVESPGQYNIRGGIVDIYPMISNIPYRMEFFDDEIDSIRSFDVVTQRSIDKYCEIEISPAKELLFSKEIKMQVLKRFEKEAKKYIKNQRDKGKEDFAHKVQTYVESKLELMRQRQSNDWEMFLSYRKDDFSTLMDYFPEDTILFIDQPQRVKERYDTFLLEGKENFKGLLEKGEVLPNQFDIFFSYEDLTKKINDRKLCIFQNLLSRSDPFTPQLILSFPSRMMHPFHGKLELLMEEVKQWKKRGYSIIILSGNEERAKQLIQSFQDFEIIAHFHQDFYTEIKPKEVLLLPGHLSKGLEYPEIKVAIISEEEIFSRRQKKLKRTKKNPKRKIESFVDLHIGDYVVHETYGIGIYRGLEKIEVDGVAKDYLNIQYANGDKLYVPTDQMDLIQPYIGAEGKTPKLNKLSGNEWKKAKNKVKKAIEDMTEELLNLYAQRQAIKGYAFSKDTPWQRQFEEKFPYEETPDQLQAIEEIKKDMESPIVMDRLLCGDVGYGKTEVALRAAFKAVMDGKQVAILVPTTILAQQHYNTMMERFSGFPVSIGILSRFQTKSQQQQTIKDLKNGMIDIVVGTHRIVQKDIQFKDLGLLIIDEEQRFGVKHKEKLKNWKKNVDVLTLSATPIPRTLHMSLVGIRDMSIIEHPPEERYPIQTYVMEYNELLIRDSILREMDRGGQVYYVYNRVEEIDRIAYHLKNLVPEAKIAVAHGQMSEHKLEKTMIDFMNGKYDVLVCTTIIETGMDVPNVNTIIVTNADKMGLSQLYQLRGRVGRSNRIAYAYITYEKDKILSEVAEKRLQAIKEFTEFGSGFKIAMRDLEIRGAGNLLGGEQHGHMAVIGYDLYCKLLEETVRKMKGIPQEEKQETTIELQIDAFIPKWYISKESHRIEMYKKIVGIDNIEELYDLQEELEDRFGDIPVPVNNLLMISYVKSLAEQLHFSALVQKKNIVYLYIDKNDFIDMKIIAGLVKKYGKKIMINASDEPYIAIKLSKLVDHQLKEIQEILQEIQILKEREDKL
ncbi:transcription-repair coupling factor [Garciella nitratireducens]|uniref:transcription-repair coupling factor n=1 Tax=Garciella nitratireducens TaxID=218205 RepID=UPI000DE8B8AB|nr:transcription-repair coupling factor [Garciella nitratireducens]RBP40611.1 transcription-repair coupling factor [Garciella nitratireducens]